jgi:tripartite-type tricarboxylate transporter receptor subunit TctC
MSMAGLGWHLGAAALSVVLAAGAVAQGYPERPVKILVPYAAGGSTDAIARLTAARLSEAFNQQFVVENRAGATGAIASEAVARSAPDGYTLLLMAAPQAAIVPAMMKVKYDPVADFAPVSNVGFNPYILAINPKVPAKTAGELVAWIKAQDKTTYASGGQGSFMNLTMVLFLQRTKLQVAAVHLRGGAEPMNNVVAGHIPMAFMNASDVVQQAAAGTVRALAITSPSRLPQMPDLPTMIEAGFKDFVVTTWNGIVAPAGTPPAIVDRLATEIQRSVKDPAFAGRLAALGFTPVGSDPKAFAAEIKSDIELWGEVVRSAGIQEK